MVVIKQKMVKKFDFLNITNMFVNKTLDIFDLKSMKDQIVR